MKKRYAPKGNLIAALDIGSSKTTCFIGRVTDDQGGFEVIGIGHHPSEGIKGGVIVDMDSAERAIRKAVHTAENMASEATKGYPLREVVINLPGTHTQSYGRSIDINVQGHEITERDVKTALLQAQDDVNAQSHPDNDPVNRMLSRQRRLIHTIPVGYRIDGHGGITDPIGMSGNLLSADIHIINADQSVLKNIAHCTDQSHLDVAAYCSGAYASGLATLVKDEKDLGCTVIDIGAGITSFAVFHSGAMIYADAIQIGGQHITNDIASGLTTSLSDAERLKKLYGNAMASSRDNDDLIDVPRLGDTDRRDTNHVQRSILIGIIQPRYEEIFELIRSRLSDSGLGQSLARSIVLTGGTSQMAGSKDLAAHVLDKQVRIGKPIHAGVLPDAASGPAFACASGLLAYAAQHGSEVSEQIGQPVSAKGIMDNIKLWLKENW